MVVSQTPINELNDRTRTIFRMVVESYLDSGTPVGSRTISKFAGLNLSPASIRNVMQDLEEAGSARCTAYKRWPYADRNRTAAVRGRYDASG